MNVLFRFRCTTCGKEILTDSVLLKCCNRLMDDIEHITMSSQELQMLISGGGYQGLVKLTNGRG